MFTRSRDTKLNNRDVGTVSCSARSSGCIANGFSQCDSVQKIPGRLWLIFKVTSTTTTNNNNVCLAKLKMSPSQVSICYKCAKHNKDNVVCEPRTCSPAYSLFPFLHLEQSVLLYKWVTAMKMSPRPVKAAVNISSDGAVAACSVTHAASSL